MTNNKYIKQKIQEINSKFIFTYNFDEYEVKVCPVNSWKPCMTMDEFLESLLTQIERDTREQVEKDVRYGNIVCPRHYCPLRCTDCLAELEEDKE